MAANTGRIIRQAAKKIVADPEAKRHEVLKALAILERDRILMVAIRSNKRAAKGLRGRDSRIRVRMSHLDTQLEEQSPATDRMDELLEAVQ